MTTSRYQNVRTPVEIGGELSPPLTPRLDYPITTQSLIGVSPLQGTAEVKVHSSSEESYRGSEIRMKVQRPGPRSISP
jgi:hypothetical protein